MQRMKNQRKQKDYLRILKKFWENYFYSIVVLVSEQIGFPISIETDE